jgi:hypothetical protein
MSATFCACGIDAPYVPGSQRQLDLTRRERLCQPVDRFELFHRCRVGGVESLWRQVSLSDVDDEEGRVEPALFHLRQVDLRVQILCVVERPRKIARVDIVMGVEGDDPIVNDPCSLQERRIVRLAGWWDALCRRDRDDDRQCQRGSRRLHTRVHRILSKRWMIAQRLRSSDNLPSA